MRTSLTTKYDYIPTGRIWPSGDFSLGYRRVDWHGPYARDKRSVQEAYDQSQDGRWTVGAMVQRELYGGRAGGWLEALDAEGHFQNPEDLAGDSCPLDLTNAPNSHKRANRPERYGRLGMTGYGKKMVRSACAILERRFKGRLTFATVTMPPLPLEQRIELAKLWPEFVRQALQWLGRKLQSQRLPKAVCSVSEIQPARLQAGNGGYLHLHMVWPNLQARPGHWAVDVLEFRSWCEKFLLSRGLLPEGSWVNVDVCKVEKSAAAYLSKYMSKGGDTLEAFAAENGWDAVPGQWWNLTKVLRDRVKAEVVQGADVGRLLENLVDYALDTCDFEPFWALRTVDMEFEGRFITAGYCGILRESAMRDCVQLVRAAAA